MITAKEITAKAAETMQELASQGVSRAEVAELFGVSEIFGVNLLLAWLVLWDDSGSAKEFEDWVRDGDYKAYKEIYEAYKRIIA